MMMPWLIKAMHLELKFLDSFIIAFTREKPLSGPCWIHIEERSGCGQSIRFSTFAGTGTRSGSQSSSHHSPHPPRLAGARSISSCLQKTLLALGELLLECPTPWSVSWAVRLSPAPQGWQLPMNPWGQSFGSCLHDSSKSQAPSAPSSLSELAHLY